MKILFVYSVRNSVTPGKPLKGQEDIQMGIALMSALLKQHGHQTSLLVLDRKNRRSNRILTLKILEQFQPEMICYSAVNTEMDFILSTARYIKQIFPAYSVLGGVHVTLSPDEKYLGIFDALCIGEGELPLTELADRLEKKEEIFEIPNLWTKINGNIRKNPPRPFLENLDALPFADRDLWQPWILEKNSRITILLGRGCPYNCTYCCNHKLKKITTGQYVRMRSPENITAEILELTATYPEVTDYFLEVETLGADVPWMEKLCYSLHKINVTRSKKITFGANLRVYDRMDFEKVFSLMSMAGFTSVTIGLESGSERIRSEVLNRRYTNETVVQAVKTARKYHLETGMFNLIGLPGETRADFLETLKMNQLIQPDWHATSIFFPYEGTILYDKARSMNLLPKTLDARNERQHAVLDLPGFSKKQIQREFDRFHFKVYLKNPRKKVIKLMLYAIQSIMGHHFMAEAKTMLIRILHRLRIKSGLMTIFQKTS